ncbi:DUF262 domain-containing protein [Agromyces sp. M3QZ16-3]|uniref:DUF262 domain-containing protein n=1 Tax=Agromyces sp. M3QZ16-3 TaxID=3447585 RepID=UPI003F691CEF
MSEVRPFQRTPSPQTASWFLDLNSARQLELDPPYQRRSVWNLEYRQFFIDSVIRNYPTQSIFVDVAIDPDGPTQYRVLDGKQRLTSLIMFTQDQFATPETLSDLKLEDTYYSDLPREVRTRVLSYLFTVETVTNATAAELNQAFDRLNRNVSRLNKQELRHAQYGGAFVTKMETFAEDTFWDQIGLITPARRRRMLDVEYVSELYVIAARGIQDGKDYLDRVYSEWDDEIEGETHADVRFRSARRFFEDLNDHLPLGATRFSNVADFYSLWSAVLDVLELGAIDPIAAAERLQRFQEELEAQETERARTYYLAARQGSNKSTNRIARAETLKRVLLGQE